MTKAQDAYKEPQESGSARPSELISKSDRQNIREKLDLTPREFEIALGLLDACSRQELAERFECSPHTIDSHLRRVFQKLGVNTSPGVTAEIFRAYVGHRLGHR